MTVPEPGDSRVTGRPRQADAWEPEPTGRLRILYVGTLPPHPGGSGFSAAQLLLRLARLGHAVRSLAPVTPHTREQARGFDARHPTLHVSRYAVPRFDIAPPVPPPSGHRDEERRALRERVPRLIDEHRPAVVLIGRESYVWDVPELARRSDVPSVLLIRGGSRTAALLDGRYPQHLVTELLARYRDAHRLVAVSRHLAAGFARLGLTGVQAIPNFVDLGRFSPRPKDPHLLASLAIAPSRAVVMHVANLQPRKRSMDVVESAAITTRHDAGLVYVVVGDGPLREPMERRSAAEGLADRFRFVGWVDYEAIPTYLSVADLVVMPSESEGQARVYIETQACGRVLVASDIPPAREVIGHGETGLLFRMGDIEDLAATTLLGARAPGLRARIGAAARDRVGTHSLEGAALAYSHVLEEVAREHGRLTPGPAHAVEARPARD